MLLPFKVFGHVDVDAFYASAAQVRNRFLVGKPVGILSNQAYFVVARSLELKKFGVKTGEPLPEAIQKCPHAIFVKRDFAWYNALSDRFHTFMRTLSPDCEEYSVDECFFVMPSQEKAETFADKVRTAVKSNIGLPVTVGLGRSKTLAKLISDTAKPFGARAVLTEADEHQLLADMPIEEVSGIAGRRLRRLAPYGIKTCLDYINTDCRFIRPLLTVEGLKLWHDCGATRYFLCKPNANATRFSRAAAPWVLLPSSRTVPGPLPSRTWKGSWKNWNIINSKPGMSNSIYSNVTTTIRCSITLHVPIWKPRPIRHSCRSVWQTLPALLPAWPTRFTDASAGDGSAEC